MLKTGANIIPKFRLHSMKRVIGLCIALSLVIGLNFNVFSQGKSKIKTIVIDAGHGGKDPGALGKKSREKNIALAVALKTGRYIEQNLPGVKVVYTRKTDKFVELHKRGLIANKADGDIFISIHCNSNPSHKPYGAETYALGAEEKRTNANLVAMTENASILLEDNQEDIYGDFDPHSEVSLMNISLLQSIYTENSLLLASKIQEQFKKRVGRKDRGVHQAGFLVLWKSAMPSVLVELGYLSNSTEEAFLMSEKGQAYMASAIYRAVKEYKREFEAESGAYEYRKEYVENKETVKPAEGKKPVPAETTKTSNLLFRVQFYTSPRKLQLNDKRFKGLKDIYEYQHNGMFKYTSGSFTTISKAEAHRKLVKTKGFSDAFTIAMQKGKRISISEARKILNEK